MLEACKDLLPVYAPSTVSFTVDEFFQDLETTLLYGCLLAQTSEESSQWQSEVIESFLSALSKLIAQVMNPLTEAENRPEWNQCDMSFFKNPDFWKHQLYSSLAAEADAHHGGKEMREKTGISATERFVATPLEVLPKFVFSRHIQKKPNQKPTGSINEKESEHAMIKWPNFWLLNIVLPFPYAAILLHHMGRHKNHELVLSQSKDCDRFLSLKTTDVRCEVHAGHTVIGAPAAFSSMWQGRFYGFKSKKLSPSTLYS